MDFTSDTKVTMKKSNNSPKCPICAGLMFRTDLSLDVCRIHEGYLITTCSDCNRKCFSVSIHLCHQCGGSSAHNTTRRSKDPRHALKVYGQE